MDTRPGDDLRAVLQSMVAVLNVGRYGAVLGDAGLAASAPGGPPHLVRLVVTLEHVALAMQFRARGRLLEAWAACLVAAASLPSYRRQDSAAGAQAQLTSEPASGEVDAYLSWWASRLVFREQYELTKFGRETLSRSPSLTPILIAGLCYLIITLPLGYLSRYLERRTGGKKVYVV